MPGGLQGRGVLVIGNASPEHRAVVVALAEAGADVAVAGPPGLPYEVQLHSISNEVWAAGRRSTVVTLDASDAVSFAAAVDKARSELGRVDIVLRCELVLDA